MLRARPPLSDKEQARSDAWYFRAIRGDRRVKTSHRAQKEFWTPRRLKTVGAVLMIVSLVPLYAGLVLLGVLP